MPNKRARQEYLASQIGSTAEKIARQQRAPAPKPPKRPKASKLKATEPTGYSRSKTLKQAAKTAPAPAPKKKKKK